MGQKLVLSASAEQADSDAVYNTVLAVSNTLLAVSNTHNLSVFRNGRCRWGRSWSCPRSRLTLRAVSNTVWECPTLSECPLRVSNPRPSRACQS